MITETPSEIKGFRYRVSDEQLTAFCSRTPLQRLRWLEEMRELTWRIASPSTKSWWREFRVVEAPELSPSE